MQSRRKSDEEKLYLDFESGLSSLVGKPNNNETIYSMQELTKEKLEQMFQLVRGQNNGIGYPRIWLDTECNLMDIGLEPPSVLEQSAIGENLHQLLEEKDHPLTDTALAYIRELEAKLEAKDEEIQYYQDELKKWDKKKTDLHKEVKALKNRANHPAYRRK